MTSKRSERVVAPVTEGFADQHRAATPRIVIADTQHPQVYKDIVPGDAINQRAAMNKAYGELADSLAIDATQRFQKRWSHMMRWSARDFTYIYRFDRWFNHDIQDMDYYPIKSELDTFGRIILGLIHPLPFWPRNGLLRALVALGNLAIQIIGVLIISFVIIAWVQYIWFQ